MVNPQEDGRLDELFAELADEIRLLDARYELIISDIRTVCRQFRIDSSRSKALHDGLWVAKWSRSASEVPGGEPRQLVNAIIGRIAELESKERRTTAMSAELAKKLDLATRARVEGGEAKSTALLIEGNQAKADQFTAGNSAKARNQENFAENGTGAYLKNVAISPVNSELFWTLRCMIRYFKFLWKMKRLYKKANKHPRNGELGFSSKWYSHYYGDVSEKNALGHYISRGFLEGRVGGPEQMGYTKEDFSSDSYIGLLSRSVDPVDPV